MNPKKWPQPKEISTPLAYPELGEEEEKNLIEVTRSGWIGANGHFSKQVEKLMGEYFDSNSLLVSNGSVALTLALRALSIGVGDEVIVPDLTYAATASSVINIGATPVFCDVDLESWNLAVEDIENKISNKTRAIIVVHLYGLPADMDAILTIAKRHNIKVIEDSAEAFGASYKGRKVGTMGDVGTYSFFPNKLLTSGEGGMVTTKQIPLYERMELFRGQGMSKEFRYYFLEAGFNFRMTEMQSSILKAQFDKFTNLWNHRENSENNWRKRLTDLVLQSKADFEHTRSPWIFTCRIPGISADAKLDFAKQLSEQGIETRPVFYPLSEMPAFTKFSKEKCRNSQTISKEGISLPTGSHVTQEVYESVSTLMKGLAHAIN